MPKQITPPKPKPIKIKKDYFKNLKYKIVMPSSGVWFMSSGTANDDEDSSAGNKKDEGKIRMSLIPPELLTAVGTILTLSANSGKYEARNWELGMEWCRVYDALIRHLNAWLAGESIDPESGKSHLWHAACNISFLIAYEERKTGIDNRPK